MEKLTDKDIIKALECCVNDDKGVRGFCNKRCPLFGKDVDCPEFLRENTLDLINRQQAEIERLNAVSEICGECHKKYAEKIAKAKSEAIKEFAERLKSKQIVAHKSKECVCVYEFDDELIDNLVAEMVGE